MRKQVLFALLALIMGITALLAGCQPGTTVTVTATTTTTATATAMTTETVTATVTDVAAVNDLQQQLDAANAELATLRLQGATKADTVANIARYYNETHTYTATDMFVCGDMSSEIWNMLKTFNINSRLVVGNIDQPVSDLTGGLVDHAWIIAEVEPNTYLAVETTGGYTVPISQNNLYYRGWYYNNPETLKKYFDDVKEYNTRVSMINDVVAEDEIAVAAYNQNNSPSQLAIHETLSRLIDLWRPYMNQLSVSINTAATVLNVSQ
jgi:signal peptidase I